MNVLYGQTTVDVLRGLKVVLNRIPFGDRTNNILMPVENKCDVNDMKTNRQNLKKNKPSGKNVASYSKSLRSRNNCVLHESKERSTYIPVPKVSKDCKVILERIEVPEVVNGCKVISEKRKVPEVAKNCKVISQKTKVPEVVKHCKVLSERTNVAQRLNDVPEIEEESRLSTPLVNRLRKCDERNYFESSLECSTVDPSKIEDTNTPSLKQKIPIYKQNIEESKENEKDPYTLDIFDLDEGKPKAKKGGNLNNSRKFNKTMYDLLEKLDKKEKKVVEKKTVTSKNIPKYDKKIKDVLQKIMNKVNDRKKVGKVVQMNGSENPTAADNISQRNRTAVTDHFLGFGNLGIQTKKVPNREKTFSIPIATPQTYSTENVPVTSKVVEANKEVLTFIESINGFECESGFLGFNNRNIQLKTPTVDQPNKSINIISNVDLRPEKSPLHSFDNQSDSCSETECNDRYFGFDEGCEDRVNFPHESIESPAFFSRRRPNANSTMIGVAQKSPWRLTVPGKLNNHFLQMKNNSLPSLNQDMVLDYSVTEESEHQVKPRSGETERPKSPVQTSILNFVEGSTDHHLNKSQENVRRSSLFDYEDFIITHPRRKVLGILPDNVLGRKKAQSTPRKEPPNLIGSPDISAVGDIFHGFGKTNDESKENENPSSRPFRIDVRDIRKYNKKMQAEKDAELPTIEETAVEQKELVEEQDSTGADEIQLYRDFDSKQEMDMSIKLPKFTYGKKRRRHIACDEAGEPKKKKKDMMTKAELDAFEKWAQEFNSMCKEVDEHQLEIE